MSKVLHPALIYIVGLFVFLVNIKSAEGLELSKIIIINDSTLTFQLFISSLPLKKPKRLKNNEKFAFSIPSDLNEILRGFILGDLHARYRNGNTSLIFKQGLNHKDYLYHLYELFIKFSPSAPKLSESLPDTRTGKLYSSLTFWTYTLPCFNDIYALFYSSGKKVVPTNIAELLTSRSLSYWIADYGSWNKVTKYVSLSTESFKLEEV